MSKWDNMSRLRIAEMDSQGQNRFGENKFSWKNGSVQVGQDFSRLSHCQDTKFPDKLLCWYRLGIGLDRFWTI